MYVDTATPVATGAPLPPSLQWLPDAFLSVEYTDILEVAGGELAALAPPVAPYSRHGGLHRTTDLPAGFALVVPPAERRVSVVDGFCAHFHAAAVLSFPPDVHLRASALPPDLQLAIRRATDLGPSLANSRRRCIRER